VVRYSSTQGLTDKQKAVDKQALTAAVPRPGSSVGGPLRFFVIFQNVNSLVSGLFFGVVFFLAPRQHETVDVAACTSVSVGGTRVFTLPIRANVFGPPERAAATIAALAR